ncbi:MAG: hypothetical protein QOF37_1698 [Thermoleophilaceae bacterium]|nr:hypothetical protein [Thermoleophilaceae bacterium]
MTALRFVPVAVAAAFAAALAGQSAEPAAAAATASSVSTNWAGYAVGGRRFRRVTGTWRVPSGSCTAGRATYSAAWVGLGGFDASSQALEQAGTELDCGRSGRASYSAWYELVPANSRTIGMKVHPGDTITGIVAVSGKRVTLQLVNRTTGKRFAKAATMSAPDVTSAEWIVEAPSGCSASSCTQLPLANFGSVSFTGARATTTGGHTGTVSDPAFSATRLDLSQGGSSFSSAAGALASSLSATGGAFGVTYRESVAARAKPTTTFPASRK